MTNDEVIDYVIRGDIPFRFIWEDDIEYNLYVFNTNISLVYNGKIIKQADTNNYPEILFSSYKTMFQTTKPTIEECISDFLFWWEINKSRCKSFRNYQYHLDI